MNNATWLDKTGLLIHLYHIYLWAWLLVKEFCALWLFKECQKWSFYHFYRGKCLFCRGIKNPLPLDLEPCIGEQKLTNMKIIWSFITYFHGQCRLLSNIWVLRCKKDCLSRVILKHFLVFFIFWWPTAKTLHFQPILHKIVINLKLIYLMKQSKLHIPIQLILSLL